MTNASWRHEYKYLCSNSDIVVLTTRINQIMKPDPHAGASGKYNIRSLYFDDLNNSSYYANENGVDPRSKYRIRIYNSDPSFIKLEKKSKYHGMTSKSSCQLTIEQCNKLIKAIPCKDYGPDQDLLREFDSGILSEGLCPSVIVDYDRIPYIYSTGNVRVTFDHNISSSMAFDSFLSDRIDKRPIMQPGQSILEVKWDDLIPDYLYNLLQTNNMERTAFSKFYLCKKLYYGGQIL